MRPSMNAVVAGLPRSWQTAPSITAICCGSRQIVDPRARLVDDQQRVDPDVAFGMPLRLLRAADERLQLRKQPLDDAELEREREADRRPRRAAAASRSRPRCARPADRRAECSRHSAACRVVERELEARGELDARAARAGCRRRTSRDRPARSSRALEVAAAVERIEVLAGQRIPGDGVDREVAPPRRLVEATSPDRPMTAKPRWPRPVFDSRRGSETSMSPTL